mgnify:FL=1
MRNFHIVSKQHKSRIFYQSFLPVDEDAIKRHIEGNDVIGIYPMTDDEKCFFLAFDFDKECWFDDINALRKREELVAAIHSVPENKRALILTTGSYIGEGI